ncbi:MULTISPECIES: FAD binding domain-containing protein [unclassified Sedimentibacter]|uniref:FAD binding domain-containing protein n=1 Tax=unclassified Sedimentibacter TaxID=2649220 RepID=UPI0027E0D54C|nr:xanthine dehydrogenase family protein subunit M [Sedimentibacter sp. MB35-C1]WMJ78712.1 xanthine dehydrogenase family protein subunit M [Sedimentibacter sp. MB35-C1]
MNILHDFEYFKPGNKKEALELVKKYGNKAKVLAGGTDLVIMMKEKMIKPDYVIDISDLNELKGITYEEGKGAEVYACTKVADIESSEDLKRKYPALAYAASQLGSHQVRVMATMGGNCCHSSPAAETPAPLSALGAKVVIASLEGEREMPIEDFIQGNRRNDLKEGEILYKFKLPEPEKNSACRYGHIGLRDAMEIDCANMAANIQLEDDKETIKKVKLVMGSVAIKPLISKAVPALLEGKKLTEELIEKTGEAAQGEAKPISDVRASAEYRKDVIAALARRLVKEAYEAAKEA